MSATFFHDLTHDIHLNDGDNSDIPLNFLKQIIQFFYNKTNFA